MIPIQYPRDRGFRYDAGFHTLRPLNLSGGAPGRNHFRERTQQRPDAPRDGGPRLAGVDQVPCHEAQRGSAEDRQSDEPQHGNPAGDRSHIVRLPVRSGDHTEVAWSRETRCE